MEKSKLVHILEILKSQYKNWNAPVVTMITNTTHDPFKILISTLLSLRTKDATTKKASLQLFERASTPEEILKLSTEQIEKLIYPVGFYHRKARQMIEISRMILKKYHGRVPDELDELLKLPGVGRKTANLVITLGFNKPGICVDTHVHRISNRMGIVKTKTPFETEMRLREILPVKWWIIYNDMLVSLGQTICRPRNPMCNICPVSLYCEKVGVV